MIKQISRLILPKQVHNNLFYAFSLSNKNMAVKCSDGTHMSCMDGQANPTLNEIAKKILKYAK